MTLYLAGPMTGIPLFNFPAFMAVANWLRSEGYVVLNPAEHDIQCGFDPAMDQAKIDPEFLARAFAWDIRSILDSDGVAFLPGWKASKGARAEKLVAQLSGKPCFDVVGIYSNSGPLLRKHCEVSDVVSTAVGAGWTERSTGGKRA